MTSTPSTPPRPDRQLIPAELVLGFHVVAVVLISVYGGGALSGVLAGHGGVRPGGLGSTLSGLWHNPGDPAAAWPTDPRPGPAWLTWACILGAVIAYGVVAGIVTVELDLRSRRRQYRYSGLAGPQDLRRSGLDGRSASVKAAQELPILASRARTVRKGWNR